jgi:hypothetical protein
VGRSRSAGMRQLIAYHFPPGAELEGQLLGAIERTESGGALRVLDVLFVGRDGESGELIAIAGRERQPGGLVTGLLGFRLDPAERRRATERALSAYDGGPSPNALLQLGELLPPGGAIAAMLVEHVWAGVVEQAAKRTGGDLLLTEFVDEAALAPLGGSLVTAIQGGLPEARRS